MRKQLLVAAAILLTSGLAHADRSKFFLAGGLGFGTNGITASTNTDEDELDTENGLLSSLKIGGVINQQHALYYHRQVSWFGVENNAGGYSSSYAGVMGLGYTYYVKPTVGSPYVEATVGLGDFRNIDGDQSFSGTGFLVGAGYELNKHVQLGATYQASFTKYNENTELELDQHTIAAKVEFKL